MSGIQLAFKLLFAQKYLRIQENSAFFSFLKWQLRNICEEMRLICRRKRCTKSLAYILSRTLTYFFTPDHIIQILDGIRIDFTQRCFFRQPVSYDFQPCPGIQHSWMLLFPVLISPPAIF